MGFQGGSDDKFDDGSTSAKLYGTDDTPIGNTGDRLKVVDTLDIGALDTIVNLTTTPVQLKVGGSTLASRKYLIMEGLDNNIKWGFSNTTQSFDIFKNQILMLPIGAVVVWAKVTTGTGTIAIGELA